MRKTLTLLLLLWGSMTALGQTVTLTVNTQPCNNNGVVTASFSGFTYPVDVQWFIAGQPTITHNGLTTSTDVLTGYNGAVMAVGVMDVNSVMDTAYLSIPPFTYTIATVPAACPVNGSATVTVTGGTAPFTYQWYNVNTLAAMSSSNPANLPDGNFGVTITDANGCTSGTADGFQGANTQGPPTFSFQVATTSANCTNGTATAGTITGGVPPYSYLWNNGATTNTITGLVAGSYNVEVTDAQGCSVVGGAYLQQSIYIGANVVTSPATCLQNDGSATSFGSGGVPPYTYLWSNTATTQGITNLAGGSYQVTVTDANNCTGIGYPYISTSTPVNVTFATTPSSCTASTGSATLTISGGVGPYTTVWNTFPVQTGVTASGLPAGNYGFMVTDVNGCVRTGTVNILPVNVIGGTFNATSPSCVASNGSLAISPFGGTSPYTYLWSNSGTTQSISGIASGNYNVTITDAIGCTAFKHIYVGATTPITLGANTTPASCIFTNDGAITITPTGGTAPYTYNWSNGGTTATITGLAQDLYQVGVSDANGCTKAIYVSVPYDPNNNSCYCTVEGDVFDDVNSNCTQDLGENGIVNIQMHLGGIGYGYTNSLGHYSFIVPTGTYPLSETVQGYYPLSGCQNNLIAVNATASSGCTITNDFANNINPIHSVRVSSTHLNPPVPGNPYYLTTVITNQGTVPEAGAIASFKADGQFPSPVFAPSGYYTGGTNEYYSMGATALTAGGSLAIMKNYNVPTNIPMGTSVVFKDSASYTAPMSNWLNDYSPWNNVSYYEPVVVSSYDPNFKEVSPKGTGTQGTITPQDSVLEYTVHFQNLGTYMAQNIVVLDTIDADLDLTTLHPIYSSHPANVTVNDAGILRYEFNNINLPAAMYNELLSHGYFIYSIEMKPNRPFATQFTNSAAIYFDYNAPVITNTTLNTLGWPTNVNNTSSTTEAGAFSLYPNPANNMFCAMINSDVVTSADLSMVDVSGKVVKSKTLSVQVGAQAVPVDVTSLSPGIYFVTYSVNGKKQTQKLVIMQ